MNARTFAWVAWSAWALLVGLAILLQIQTAEDFPAAWVLPILGLGSFMTVGAIVVSRQPRNTIGWLCCAAGLAGGLAGFSAEYARYALGPQRGSLPGGLAMAWLYAWVGTFWAGLVLSFLLLLFPTGRLPSRRWRPVAWACAVCVTALCVLEAVMPGPLEASGQRNPLGIYGAGQLGLLFAVATVLPGFWDQWVPLPVSDLVFGASFAMIPVTIGIAILRYRLYDIDRLIHRTLVYGLLTALLAAVYTGLVPGRGRRHPGRGRAVPAGPPAHPDGG
jgi:hypothetical protein